MMTGARLKPYPASGIAAQIASTSAATNFGSVAAVVTFEYQMMLAGDARLLVYLLKQLSVVDEKTRRCPISFTHVVLVIFCESYKYEIIQTGCW
jgi:hypothetical protein